MVKRGFQAFFTLVNLSREFVYVQREPSDGFKVTDLIYNTQFTLSPQIIKLYKKTINERGTNITIKLQKKTINERDTNITIKSVTEKTTSERDTNISIKLQKKTTSERDTNITIKLQKKNYK